MKEYYQQIKQLELFRGVTTEDKDFDWMFRCIDGNVKTFRAGEIIIKEGEDMYFAGIVLEGIVQGISREGTFYLFDPGSLLSKEYRDGKSVAATCDYRAKTDCTLLFMRWIRMMKVCNFECAFHKKLIENLQKFLE